MLDTVKYMTKVEIEKFKLIYNQNYMPHLSNYRIVKFKKK